MQPAIWILCGLCAGALCACDGGAATADGDAPGADGARRDAAPVLAEATAALCDDGQDNDGDGFVDCEDQDCWPLARCAPDGAVDRDLGEAELGADAAPFPPDGGDAGAADAGAGDGPCVPQSSTLAIVTPSGGSACSFPFSKPHTPGMVNLLLTPGWGTVCYAGSSSNCGAGASADGWWFSGGEIALCDATCNRFWAQTQAGKLTVQLGCPTESCSH